MATLRARLDVIVVMDVDGKAVQYEFFTTMRDQMELTKRFKNVADDPSTATPKLLYCAAQRVGISPEGESFDDFIDRCLDLEVSEASPLGREQTSAVK